MSKTNKKPDEVNIGNEIPEEGAVDPTEANPAAGGAVEPQENGKGIQPSVDPTEGNNAAEGAVEFQEDNGEGGKSPAYRVNYRYGLNLRSGPGREYPVIRVLPNGKVILAGNGVVEVGSTVWYPTGEGWVDSAYLTPVEES